MPKIKDKKRILKAARKKNLATYKGTPIRFQLISHQNLAGQKGSAGNIQSDEKQGPTTKITIPSKAITRIKGQIKSFTDKKKLK